MSCGEPRGKNNVHEKFCSQIYMKNVFSQIFSNFVFIFFLFSWEMLFLNLHVFFPQILSQIFSTFFFIYFFSNFPKNFFLLKFSWEFIFHVSSEWTFFFHENVFFCAWHHVYWVNEQHQTKHVFSCNFFSPVKSSLYHPSCPVHAGYAGKEGVDGL